MSQISETIVKAYLTFVLLVFFFFFFLYSAQYNDFNLFWCTYFLCPCTFHKVGTIHSVVKYATVKLFLKPLTIWKNTIFIHEKAWNVTVFNNYLCIYMSKRHLKLNMLKIQIMIFSLKPIPLEVIITYPSLTAEIVISLTFPT